MAADEVGDLLVNRTQQLKVQTERLEKLIAALQSIKAAAEQALEDITKPASRQTG